MSNDSLTLRVLALYLSHTAGAISAPVAELRLRPNYGVEGDSHSGPTQVAESGEVVPNLRQWTAVNPRELGEVAEDLGIPYIDPAWVKANICFGWSSADPFTQTLVPGTLLLREDKQPVLEIKGAVDPCLGMGKIIAAQWPLLALKPERFPKAAYDRRGVHGIVLEETTIKLGDTFTVVLPEAARGLQRAEEVSV